MTRLERVARAICRANGGIPDDVRMSGDGPLWTVYLADAQAAIDAMGDGWQPIETAPTDTTIVDIWRGEWKERACNMYRQDLGGGNVFYVPVYSGPSCVRDATHWRPITEPQK
jgi:hypothetical protein